MSGFVDRQEAIRLLTSGEVVALPTDTVYGLAASLAHREAVAALFEIKQRPASTALPVLVDSVTSVAALGVTWTDEASRLSAAFWPGALTIVVSVDEELAALVGSLSATVGFRVPDDDVLREILVVTGPLAVSSANVHGEAPSHNAHDVLRVFSGATLAGVLDGGERNADVSTVVSVAGPLWSVLRQGSITADDLARALSD